MERSRAVLITLICVLFSRISGAEVEMRVRPGDDVTLYSDCVWEKFGINTVWFRNCSHEHQPRLIISTNVLISETLQRYSFVWNSSNQAHDLLVKNVFESDLGLYYCAVHEKMITKDETGVMLYEDVYHYGNTATRLSLLDLPQTPTTPPVSDCSVCWKLLVSLCPVCVVLSSLLSSTCVYCICRNTTKGPEERRELLTESVFQVGCSEEHQCERSMNGNVCFYTEVCYTSLKSALNQTKHTSTTC